MDATVFVRQPNAKEYTKLGKKKFSVIPRQDEYLSAEWEGDRRYFQVFAVHHSIDEDGLVEIFAVSGEPVWQAKKGRTIGFGH